MISRLRRPSASGIRLPLTVAVAVLALLASACGSSDSTSSGANSSAGATADTGGGQSMAGAELDQTLADMVPAKVRSAGVLTLATDPTDPPLEFYNESNELIGAEIDLANAIGSVLALKVAFVPAKFDTIIPGIQAGRYDGSVSGFADRPARQEVVDFVDYFRTARGFLVKAGTNADIIDVADLCGRSVAVAAGTTMVDAMVELAPQCVSDGKAAPTSQTFPDVSQAVLAVQAGRADVTVLPKHAALWIAKNSEGALEVVGKPKDGNDINGIVLAKDGEMQKPVQAAIQKLMDNGTFTEIFTKWNLQDVALTEATVNAGK